MMHTLFSQQGDLHAIFLPHGPPYVETFRVIHDYLIDITECFL